MVLQVIGAGFGRTGTKSLKEALEQLGYVKCHHMAEVAPNPKQIDCWARVCQGEKVNWDEVFEGFEAAVDWPAAAFYKELADHYPDAKIILTVRDPEAWYKSVSETIYPLGKVIPGWISTLRPSIRTLQKIVFQKIWGEIFGGRFEDKDHALKVFRDNIETCKRIIPPERLLVHQAKDGWEPLCAFLGKPIPATPYPRVNETKDMQRAIRRLQLLGYAPWLLLAIVVAVVAAIVLR